MDLTHIQRSGPDEDAWSVALPGDPGGDHALFRDSEFGGVLPALLEALGWRSDQTGARKDWGWVEEGLERVDRGGTHGWWASVDLGTHLDADLFEDLEHGGPREALLAALAWRQRVARSGGGGGGRASGPPREGSGAPRRGEGGGGAARRGDRRPKEKREGAAPPGPRNEAQPRRAGRKRSRPRRPPSRPSS